MQYSNKILKISQFYKIDCLKETQIRRTAEPVIGMVKTADRPRLLKALQSPFPS